MASVLLACGFSCQLNRAPESSETSFCTPCLLLERDQYNQISHLLKLQSFLLVFHFPLRSCSFVRTVGHYEDPPSACRLLRVFQSSLILSERHWAGVSQARWPVSSQNVAHLDQELLAVLSIVIKTRSLSKIQKIKDTPLCGVLLGPGTLCKAYSLLREAGIASTTKDRALLSTPINHL